MDTILSIEYTRGMSRRTSVFSDEKKLPRHSAFGTARVSRSPVGLGLPERSHCEVMAFSVEFGPPLRGL